MILPLPRVHCTGLDDIHFKLRDDGALQTPPKPRNPTGICDSIEFRFSQDPKNKRTQRGSESHTSVGILGVWLIAKDLLLEGSSPTWRVGIAAAVTANRTGASRGWAIKGLESDIALSPFREGLNRDSGLILAHGKRACTGVCGDCMGRRLPEVTF